MALKCPRCDIGMLEEIEVGDVLIDRCTTCAGLWFDQGEIAEMTQRDGDVREIELMMSDDECRNECPRCEGLRLRRVQVSDGTSLLRCPSCLGTWVDRGVLRHGEDKGIGDQMKRVVSRIASTR